MGYLNEFPHFEANTLNLDWLLEQYSTFNKRLQELHDHFDEAVATMEQDIAQFKTYVNGELTSIRNDFNEFTELVNSNFETLSTELTEVINEAHDDIENQITEITNNMVEYVSDHMDEWQAEASYNNHILKLSNEASPSLDDEASVYGVQLDGVIHQTRLQPPAKSIYIMDDEIADNGQLGHSTLTIDEKGTYLIIRSVRILPRLGAPMSLNASYDVFGDSQSNYQFLTGAVWGTDLYIKENESSPVSSYDTDIFINNSDDTIFLEPLLVPSDATAHYDIGYTVTITAIKIADAYTPTILQ